MKQNMTKAEIELLIRFLTGGASPSEGDVLYFDSSVGWVFRGADEHNHNDLYYTKTEVDAIIAALP